GTEVLRDEQRRAEAAERGTADAPADQVGHLEEDPGEVPDLGPGDEDADAAGDREHPARDRPPTPAALPRGGRRALGLPRPPRAPAGVFMAPGRATGTGAGAGAGVVLTTGLPFLSCVISTFLPEASRAATTAVAWPSSTGSGRVDAGTDPTDCWK